MLIPLYGFLLTALQGRPQFLSADHGLFHGTIPCCKELIMSCVICWRIAVWLGMASSFVKGIGTTLLPVSCVPRLWSPFAALRWRKLCLAGVLFQMRRAGRKSRENRERAVYRRTAIEKLNRSATRTKASSG